MCKELGITIFTVSHRKSLRRHHDYQLKFIGNAAGDYEWTKIEKSEKKE